MMSNINSFYIPPTQCSYVFGIDLRTNSEFCLLRGGKRFIARYVLALDVKYYVLCSLKD